MASDDRNLNRVYLKEPGMTEFSSMQNSKFK